MGKTSFYSCLHLVHDNDGSLTKQRSGDAQELSLSHGEVRSIFKH
jgi:hypothetical protein